MKRPDPVTVILVVLVALAAARYGHELVKLVVETSQIDFGTFYTFTDALWRGDDPFRSAGQPAASLGIARAETPPTFAPGGYLLFAPFVGLPYRLARVAWLVVGQAALATSLWMLWRRLTPPLTLALGGLAIVLGYQPIYEDVAVGNVNLVVLALLTLAAVNDPRRRPWAIAAPLSVAVTLKLYCAALLPLLALAGAPTAAVVATGLAVLWSGLALVVYGAGWLPAYAHFLAVDSAPLHAWARNLSPHAALHRLIDTGPNAVVEMVAIALAVAIAVWAGRAARAARGGSADVMLMAWATAVTALPLMSPLTEEHHLVVTLLPLLVAIWRVPALRPASQLVWLTLATALLATRYSLEGFPRFAAGALSLATVGKAAGLTALFVVVSRAAPAPTTADGHA